MADIIIFGLLCKNDQSSPSSTACKSYHTHKARVYGCPAHMFITSGDTDIIFIFSWTAIIKQRTNRNLLISSISGTAEITI